MSELSPVSLKEKAATVASLALLSFLLASFPQPVSSESLSETLEYQIASLPFSHEKRVDIGIYATDIFGGTLQLQNNVTSSEVVQRDNLQWPPKQ